MTHQKIFLSYLNFGLVLSASVDAILEGVENIQQQI